MTMQANFVPTAPIATAKEYSVSEISSKIKNIIELECGYVRVRGEISGLKIASSGHGYFNLKDNDSILASTCWRPVVSKLTFTLEEGMEVIASGKISTYSSQSKYQLSVEKIEPAGVGTLMQLLMQRKAKLEKEGLFDATRKRPLPFLPQRIGIVTSLTGAVIKDMLHRIKDRCPVHVIVWPSVVQGENAATEITAGINHFNQLEGTSRPDVIIIARGGGSIEDLWAFNEEIVVRAVASSAIPVISAIGHETDFTLTDFAADIRAPTPTAAIEFALPVLRDLKYTINQHFNRLHDILDQIVNHKTRIISICDNILSNPMKLIRRHEQTLDYLIFRISDPSKMLNLKAMQLEHVTSSMQKSMFNILLKTSSNLNLQAQLLSSLDYNNVLKRGFAIVKAGDKIVTSASILKDQDNITVQMRDGEVTALVQSNP